ncbi:MAG TPA: hypothetical protein VGB13_12380 [Candidatus Krumholzibacteria bacterium]
MATTIHNSPRHLIWSSTRYLLAASAGFALAVAALTGLGTNTEDRSVSVPTGASTLAAAPAAERIPATAARPGVVYYLVESEEARSLAENLRAAMAEFARADGVEPQQVQIVSLSGDQGRSMEAWLRYEAELSGNSTSAFYRMTGN